jgi:hypothetical protein
MCTGHPPPKRGRLSFKRRGNLNNYIPVSYRQNSH